MKRYQETLCFITFMIAIVLGDFPLLCLIGCVSLLTGLALSNVTDSVEQRLARLSVADRVQRAFEREITP